MSIASNGLDRQHSARLAAGSAALVLLFAMTPVACDDEAPGRRTLIVFMDPLGAEEVGGVAALIDKLAVARRSEGGLREYSEVIVYGLGAEMPAQIWSLSAVFGRGVGAVTPRQRRDFASETTAALAKELAGLRGGAKGAYSKHVLDSLTLLEGVPRDSLDVIYVSTMLEVSSTWNFADRFGPRSDAPGLNEAIAGIDSIQSGLPRLKGVRARAVLVPVREKWFDLEDEKRLKRFWCCLFTKLGAGFEFASNLKSLGTGIKSQAHGDEATERRECRCEADG